MKDVYINYWNSLCITAHYSKCIISPIFTPLHTPEPSAGVIKPTHNHFNCVLNYWILLPYIVLTLL